MKFNRKHVSFTFVYTQLSVVSMDKKNIKYFCPVNFSKNPCTISLISLISCINYSCINFFSNPYNNRNDGVLFWNYFRSNNFDWNAIKSKKVIYFILLSGSDDFPNCLTSFSSKFKFLKIYAFSAAILWS